MNGDIRDELLLALRKHVERSVRPVRASESRKLQIREELLAHLTAIFLEEQAKQPDENEALSAALARFGQPAELTEQLDASQPWNERWAFCEETYFENPVSRWLNRWFDPRADEPLWRYVARSGPMLLLMNLIPFVVVPAVVSLVLKGSGWPADPATQSLLPKLYFLLVAAGLCILLVFRSFKRLLDVLPAPRRWWRTARAAVGCSLTMVVLVALFWWSIPAAGAKLEFFAAFLALLFLALMLCAWLMRFDHNRRLRREAWTKLELGE